MSEPKVITAGDTATWTRTEALYPASLGWVLTYYLSLGAASPKVFSSTPSGADHLITVLPAVTATWYPGTYHWTVRASKAGEVHTTDSGTIVIAPDPTTAVDRRTHAERCLAVIEAALEASVGSATVEYEFDGVKVKKDRSELVRIRDRYKAEVRAQRAKTQLFRPFPVVFR